MLAVPKIEVQTSTKEDEISPTADNEGRSRNASLSVPMSPGDTHSSASSFMGLKEMNEALLPDPGTEADFEVDRNPFAYSPGQLNKLLNPKSLEAFMALGGLRGIERGLRTDVDAGLSVDESTLDGRISIEDARSYMTKTKESYNPSSFPRSVDGNQGSDPPFKDRLRVFKNNTLPARKATSLLKLMWMAYNDKVLLLLTAAAVISLALGLYETFGAEHEPGTPTPVDWVEGLAICVAIIIVVLVGSLNDYQKERAFVRLNQKKEDRLVKVIRSGKPIMLSVHEILVGDVLHLEPGDLIPADGVFISGHNVKCDESSATGESDQIKKTGGDAVQRLLEAGHQNSADMDPFIISGSKVLEGVGTYVVTSVGMNSSFGKIMMAMRQEDQSTPLQNKLDGLATAIAKLGGGAAALLFFVLLFRFCASLPGDVRPSQEKASSFMDILIVAITVIVVAVPEGLPLAVTLALAFATTRLLKENNLVRILRACETMGNATSICSDKTGTLTTNQMTVVTGTFCQNRSFDDSSHNMSPNSSQQFAQKLPSETKDIVVQSIALNSTAFESDQEGQTTFIGSKTETALLNFAQMHLGMGSLAEQRANAEIVQIMPFDSNKKCMGAVVKLPGGAGYRLLVKGAAEILLKFCTGLGKNGGDEPNTQSRGELEEAINAYAEKSLRTIALIYRDFQQWPPAGPASEENPQSADLAAVLKEMTFLGIVGIQDPVRPGVPDAVAKCKHAGVMVRMVTGDNVVTAKAIATECGIYKDGLVLEGPVFRAMNEAARREAIPQLEVLARSSPEDKRILVRELRDMGEIVAATGDGTNDGPALKAADIGFSMGISGTEVAKEASAIVLMDDNFASILTALMWGRAVNDAVNKFLQFQITVNITAVLLTFVSAVVNPDMSSVLTAVQLLWVNLIMDTFAALALATDPPTPEILDRKPTPKTAPLISINMWKMIIGQAIFQLIVTYILYFAGGDILGYTTKDQELELDTMVFNTFVWMQIFNEFNNRRLDNKFNIFQGIHRNYFFIVINCIMVGAQIAIVFVGGRAFSITPIDGVQWAICIVLAVFSLPMAVLIRIFPDPWFEAIALTVLRPFLATFRSLKSGWASLMRAFGRKGKSIEDESKPTTETSEVAFKC
ncbi:plasma membrane calcium [Arachnomyces sp. PD_36]|nr:plasma membrane calcium [Arachnomyces sp. PD_36]